MCWLSTRPTRCWGSGAARCPVATARRGRRACVAGTATAGGAAAARSWRCSSPIPGRRWRGAASPAAARSRAVTTAPAATGCACATATGGPAPGPPTRRPGRPLRPQLTPRRRGRVSAAVLHAVDGERPQHLLQEPHHPVAAAGQPRDRGVHHPLPAARPSPHRLPQAGPAAAPGVPVRRAVPPRRPDDHRTPGGGGLGHHRGPSPPTSAPCWRCRNRSGGPGSGPGAHRSRRS